MSSDAVVGQAALVSKLGLRVPAPSTTSIVGPGARRTEIENGRTVEKYRPSSMPEDDFVGHLRFALRFEPLDLGVLAAAFKVASRRDLERWVSDEPSSAFARRAWFFYEWLTDSKLDLRDSGFAPYVDALDPEKHIVGPGTQSRRHRVVDNLLGVRGFCPTVRRTSKLDSLAAEGLDVEARSLVESCDPGTLARAVDYLYTKETKSTFAIEHETATGQRAQRFVAALRAIDRFDPTSVASLLDLQRIIVDPRYAAKGLRDFQNFVGETVGGYREVVHFICPRPEDVAGLMTDWSAMTKRLMLPGKDPVVAATLAAFAFVFIHPFEDGNGRIHRYLIHQMLSAKGFTPPDVLFPVSAAIVRDRRGYDAALETFSGSILPHIEWKFDADKQIEVSSDSADLYRYFDATALAEFLYAKVAETVRKDLKEELDFVSTYDRALVAVMERIDMPDRRASLFVRLCLQNGGALSRRKRADFPELTDDEVAKLQDGIAAAIAEETAEALPAP